MIAALGRKIDKLKHVFNMFEVTVHFNSGHDQPVFSSRSQHPFLNDLILRRFSRPNDVERTLNAVKDVSIRVLEPPGHFVSF